VLRKYAHVETYRDYERMLREARLDAVIVATPTSTHYRYACAALEHGLHVFVEKPLTLSAAESRDLAERAARRRCVNQVGFHNRFIGTFQEARRLVGSGAVGTLRTVTGTAFGQVIVKRESSTWRSRSTEGGGCLHDYACHVIDLMNFVVGPPERVAGAHLESVYSTEVEDVVRAAFEYRLGATGALETNWSDERFRKMTTTITIEGTAGRIVADRQEVKVELHGGGFETYPPGTSSRYITSLQKPVNYYMRGEEYSAQMDAFVDAILNGRAGNENSFASACLTDEIVEKIRQTDRART
jgi:predicted dehydrogenase